MFGVISRVQRLLQCREPVRVEGVARVTQLQLVRLEERTVPTAGILRIVTYNTANDVNDSNTVDFGPRAGMSDVLQAIGALNVSGSTGPIDILALQESVYHTGMTVNPTAQGFADLLNSIYPGNAYTAATLNGKTDGNNVGNGPQTLVYRGSTLQLLSH
jgi:hypothetical protein